jgi:pyruvate formate lyase activating enzyme
MNELEDCQLCEWRCKVNRLKGEKGVCGIGLPRVALSTLHPAPPASFDAFMLGCNFKCLGCQNYTVSMVREKGEYIPPEEWAELGLAALNSGEAQRINADRLFFTGGEPTCSLPWVEAVAEYAKTKVNFDTNGFMTTDSLERILTISDSLTFDIKAFSENAHRLLTGAPAKPVLRNVKYVIEHALEKVYEFRVVLVPGFVEEAAKIAEFLATLSEDAPLCYLAFRPNFVLDTIRGSTLQELEDAVERAKEYGLKKVNWAGLPNIPGRKESIEDFKELAVKAGCKKLEETQDRLCNCEECTLRLYTPQRRT